MLQLVGSYYKWVVLLSGMLVVLKLVLAYWYYGKIQGVIGIFYAIFKWYGPYQREMAETDQQLNYMRLQNLVSLVLYILIALIVVFNFVVRYLVH